MIELLLVLMAAATVTAWWQLMHARQKARKAAGHVCSSHDLQLLDDTVSLSSVTLSRSKTEGRFTINYSFEFATNGARRKHGIARVALPACITVTLDLDDGRLIEQFRG